jgi:hypothetical protein
MTTNYLGLSSSKPGTQPKFAELDLVDPTSGVNNVTTPTTAQQNYGWHPFRQRPKRDILNWIHRHSYKCINWLMDTFYPGVDQALYDIDGRITAMEPNIRRVGGTLNASLLLVRDELNPLLGWQLPGSPYSQGTPRITDHRHLDFTLRWELFHDLFILQIPELYNPVNDTTHVQTVLSINDTIPQIWKDSVKDLVRMSCLVYNPPAAVVSAHMTLSKSTWDEVPWLNILTEDPALAEITNWHNSVIATPTNGMAGMPCQVIIGYCDY